MVVIAMSGRRCRNFDPKLLQDRMMLRLGGLQFGLKPRAVCTHPHGFHTIFRNGFRHHVTEFLTFLKVLLQGDDLLMDFCFL